jgi:hypothetical protein
MDQELVRVLGHHDALEQAARRRPLLRDDGILVLPAPICVPHCVGAAIGDPGEQRLCSERPIDAAPQ